MVPIVYKLGDNKWDGSVINNKLNDPGEVRKSMKINLEGKREKEKKMEEKMARQNIK